LTTTVLAEDQVRDLVEKMLKSSGRRVDLSAPFVDAMLPDGSRLHVVIPDITRRFWSVNIRKFVVRASHLDDLVALGSITPPAARFLDAAVRSGLNVLVSGGTQAGKTTLLNCLAAAVPAQERVVTAEEVFELKIPLPDVVSLQCRQPSLEGTGEIKLRRLVKEALRMRPSRIIVGEVRQEESLDLLIALNSGLPKHLRDLVAAGHPRRTASRRWPERADDEQDPEAAGQAEQCAHQRSTVWTPASRSARSNPARAKRSTCGGQPSARTSISSRVTKISDASTTSPSTRPGIASTSRTLRWPPASALMCTTKSMQPATVGTTNLWPTFQLRHLAR
jgi:energy-coupling factor transporter ATP-binding protein EcfA2